MNRLTILHTEWSDGWGGQEIRIVEEATAIARRGHRVAVVARPGSRILARARAAGLAVYELQMRSALDWRAVWALRSLIRAEKASIVNTHSSVDSWVGAFAAKLTGTALVRTRHLSSDVPAHPLNFIYRIPDAVVTTGEAIRQQLIKHSRLRPEKVVSIPTGVDVEKFVPRPPDLATKRALGLSESCKVVAIVAVLRRFKRHDLFLEAASMLHDGDSSLRFVIVGDGPQRANIEKIIRDRRLTNCVLMTGHCEDVRPIMSFSDVVVLSSDSGEGVPQAVAQALAMARPVVAADVGGVSELVRHQETGLLVPPRDARALASAIARCLRDAVFAADCGRRGREHVSQNFSKERMVEQTLLLYEKLLA